MPAQYANNSFATLDSFRFYAPHTITQQVALQNAIGSFGTDWMAYSNGLHNNNNQSNIIGNRFYSMVGGGGIEQLTMDRRLRSVTNDINDDGSSMSSSTMTTTFGGKEYLEERVQIDRKKLEHMISATDDHEYGRSENLTAEEFFSQVMTRTSTQITWPSRLKIGAKTKKDPYVKILGRLCDVQLAKDMILSVLETRHSRVTLKIDVAFTDHSHIIGKQGRNTQQVMKETGCHIHFPDSNRNPELEKSNMVSIAGPLEAVEKARQHLRSLAPLVVTFELKNYYGDPSELGDDPFINEIAAAFSVGVLIRQNRSSGQPFIVVRGSAYQENVLKEAALRLQQHFLRTTKFLSSTSLEVLPSQQPAVLGPHNSNIRLISELTGAAIHHPRSDSAGATTFFIQGTVETILNARRHLIGCLPVSLIFEMHDSPKVIDINDLERQHDMSISLRPKRNGETKQNVVLKGGERQMSAIYSVRRMFLDKDEPVVKCYDYDFMKTFDTSKSSSSGVTSTLMQPSSHPLVINSTSIAPSPMFNGMATMFALSPPFSPLEAFGFNCSNDNGTDNNSLNTLPSAAPSFTSLDSFGFHTTSTHSVDCNALGTLTSGSATGFNSFGSSRSSPTESQTPNNLFMCSAELSGSSNNTSVNGHLHNDPVPEEAPLASGLLEAVKKYQQENAAQEWKAPGAERLPKTDWAQEKLLANKVMQERATGSRVPTDHWAGFGFSRSMPAAVIRQRLLEESRQKQNKLKDLVEEDEDKIGPWRLEPNNIINEPHRKALNATSYFDFAPSNNGINFSDGDDVVTLLTKLELSKYVDIFREQEIDMKTFLTMTDEDLKDVGVNAFGPRKKMLRTISELNESKKHFA